MTLKSTQTGLSAIEFVVVFAVIGALTLIAIPCMKNFHARSQFAAVITATDPYKKAITVAIEKNIPRAELNTGKHGIPAAPKPNESITSLTVNNGVITAIASKKLHEHTYILTPDAKGTIWKVSGSCLQDALCDA